MFNLFDRLYHPFHNQTKMSAFHTFFQKFMENLASVQKSKEISRKVYDMVTNPPIFLKILYLMHKKKSNIILNS